MKKTLAILLVLTICLSAVFANGSGEAGTDGGEKIKVVLLTDATGIDDKSFNAAAWRGILEFYGDNGAGRGKYYENITAQTSDDYIPNLKNASEADWDLIITTGFTWGDSLESVTGLYPEQKYIIIDVDYLTSRPNLIQYIYEEEQGSYLVGVAAAEQARADGVANPKFGFVGGVAGATITKFEIGYIEGVKSVYPNAEIVDFYVNSWGDPAAAKTAAKSMYDSGVYCVFAAAGGSGLGVIAQAKEERLAGRNVWAIGVDSDQYEDGIYTEGKSAVLTSMIKKVENSTVDALKKVEGVWEGGIVKQNMANGGVGFSTTNAELKDSAKRAAEAAGNAILKGTLVVDKTYAAAMAAGLAPRGLGAIDD
ncbi:MAG: BMP family lipoprotein [Sphaerochaeta sp.]